MTSVVVNTYTHSVVYLADNILKSLKDVIRLSGLDPSKLINEWETLMRGLKTWLGTRHLQNVVLEIFAPKTGALILRWDIGIVYAWSDDGGGSFWADTEQLKYAIKKAGVAPSDASYRIVLQNSDGHPSVEGWSDTSLRSTANMVRQSLGTTIEHSGLGGNAAYWRTI